MPIVEKMICITCPKGCTLEVTREGETILDVIAGCKRGKEYAHRELTDPRRMIASTVRIRGGLHPLLPVYTEAPFPKGKISDLVVELRKLELQAPIQMGEVVLNDVLGTGINIIASRDIPVK